MSTLTKIKGEILNYSLPVVTEEGLIPYWEGRYINALAEKNYTLTEAQRDAVSTFLDDLINHDIINAVKNFWPFVGNSTNVNAAKVPLIGTKDFDFANDFTDFLYNGDNEVVGITSTPAVSSLTAMDFCTDNCFVVGISYIKDDTSAMPAGFINRAFHVGYPAVLQFRHIYTNSLGQQCMSLYSNQYGSESKEFFNSPHMADNISEAGNAYEILGYNDQTSAPYYCRASKVNSGKIKALAGTDTSKIYAPPTQVEKAAELKSLTFDYTPAITGLVIFNRVLNTKELEQFVNAHKAMNIALGKEATV